MITHILKDQRQLNSVSGIVITQKDFPQVYKVIEQIEKEGVRDEAVSTSGRSSKSYNSK